MSTRTLELDTLMPKLISKYTNEPFSDDLCDSIMADIKTALGKDVAAQVILDTDDNSISVSVKDHSGNIKEFSTKERKNAEV